MEALYELTETEYEYFEAKATIDHAKEWNEDDEKYVYCLDYLELSAWDDNADLYVNKLEYHFEALLDEAA